jgi:hypothetical protein
LLTARRVAPAALLAILAFVLVAARATAPDARGLRLGAAQPQSLGAMTFGPDGTLFVADARGSALFAFDVADRGTAAFGDRVLSRDVDQKVASLLGTTRERIRFQDMAVHPATSHVYLSVARVDGEATQPALVRVKGPDAVELVDLRSIKFATAPIPGTPSRDGKTPWGQPQWTLAVTDLAFVDGQLLVAGLSNEQFASALRRVPFPFGDKTAVNTVEIYHTSHDKWETAAPIEAFVPITIGGEAMIVAGYGCSPIATFKRSDLARATHLKGRTVAELGGGNRPIDMIRYQKNGKEWILVANSHRTLMRLDPAEIARAPEMTKPVSQAYEPGGVGYLPVASAGVMQLDDLNADNAVVLQRDIESGTVHLVALSKRWL